MGTKQDQYFCCRCQKHTLHVCIGYDVPQTSQSHSQPGNGRRAWRRTCRVPGMPSDQAINLLGDGAKMFAAF
jgi:ribosomal protein L44E